MSKQPEWTLLQKRLTEQPRKTGKDTQHHKLKKCKYKL